MSPQAHPRVVNFEGAQHSFPPDATDDEIRQALNGAHPAVPGTEKLGGTPPAAPKVQLPPAMGPHGIGNEPNLTDGGGGGNGPQIPAIVNQGLHQLGRAIPSFSNSIKRGFSDLIEGGAKTAAPLAIPALVAAPLPTLGAAVVGGGAQAGGEKIAEHFGASPDTSRFVGNVAGLAGGALGSRIPGAVRPLIRVNPEVAAEKAWRPSANDSEFPKVAPSAVSDVKTFGNPQARTNADTIPGAQAAIENHSQALDAWMSRARDAGVTVSGDDIVSATQRAIPQTMWLENPAEAKALVEQMHSAYGGRHFSVDEFRQFLREKNAGTASFYGKSAAGQRTGVTAGVPAAIEKAQGDAIRETLYNALDPESQGAGPREIQQRTGGVINLRNAADRRSNAVMGEKPTTPIGGIGKVVKGLINLPGSLITGDIEKSLGQITHPISGPSDALIKRLYGAVPDANPLPMPGGPIRRPFLLGSGQQTIDAAPDSSFVRSSPGMGSLTPNRLALPAAPQIHVTPPPADTSFVRGNPGMAQPPNPARALPAGPAVNITPAPADTSFVQGNPLAPHQQVDAMPRLIEGPQRPGIPTGQGVNIVPPADTSGLTVSDAAKGVARDPKTGRNFRFYDSRPLKKN